MKCPDCGFEMVKLKGNGRFECRNESCPVIEVRVRKKGVTVLRDSVMTSRLLCIKPRKRKR